MKYRGKNYRSEKEKVEKNKLYSKEEAIKLVKELSNVKFDATVEVAMNLNLDVKKADQQLRGAIVLPKGTGKNVKVARVMPNLPCSINFGMAALDLSDFEDDVDDCAFVQEIFNSVGNTLIVPEEKLNAVTGISGSGPAYVYMFIDGLIRAGIKQGLSEDEAKTLAVNTVVGGAEMVVHTEDKTIDEMIAAVCSKGGTTIQAVESFRKDDMDGMIDRAVSACVKRAEELSE